MKEITIEHINQFFDIHKDMSYLRPEIEKAVTYICDIGQHNKILVCGNGGSCADSEHIAGELLKSFVLKRKVSQDFKQKLQEMYGEEGAFIADNLQQGVKCIPLTSFSAYNTAFLNDCNADMLYAQLVNVLGEAGDVLIAISTSGNSKNVVYAAKIAKAKGIKVIALTGEGGGKLKDLADVLLNVPSRIVYKIQEMHLPLYHLICLCVESELFEA